MGTTRHHGCTRMNTISSQYTLDLCPTSIETSQGGNKHDFINTRPDLPRLRCIWIGELARPKPITVCRIKARTAPNQRQLL